MSLFIYIKSFKEEFVISEKLEMDIVYSVASMALYIVFISCLATIVMTTLEIIDMVIQFPIFLRTCEDY